MPVLDRPWIVAVASVYLIAVLVIGFWAARRTRTTRDFFIAGQSIGLIVMALATMSAAFSGFVFLGGPGLTYRPTARLALCSYVDSCSQRPWVRQSNSFGSRVRVAALRRPTWTPN